MSSQVFVGIAVATAPFDIALRPTGDRWGVTHDDVGITARVTRLQTIAPQRIVLEATGSSQRAVVTALAAAGLPVVGVNPRHARALAQATGQLAKTDVLDARTLAHVADAVRPVLRPLPDGQTEDLRALMARRRPLVTRRTAAQHRLGSTPRCLQADLPAHIPGLHARLTARDNAVDTTWRASPVWRERAEWLRSVPGIGPVCARPLVLDLPEWGTLRRQRLAALVGVAPFPRDRGTLRGLRRVWGGRAQGRTALDRSPLVAVRYHPVLKAFSERLRAAGKAAKGALTACMRTLLTLLNALVQHPTLWQPQEVAIAL